MEFFLKGLLAGFAIAIPVGPVGILCIRRALSGGTKAAFFAGFGAAVADAIYGAIAAFGLTFIADFLIKYEVSLRVIGGIFVLFLAAKTFRLKTPSDPEFDTTSSAGFIRDALASFFITLTNPGTLVGFTLVLPIIGATPSSDEKGLITLLVLGVFLGSTLWWVVLSFIAGAFQSRFKRHWLDNLNKVSGIVLAVLALSLLISLLWY